MFSLFILLRTPLTTTFVKEFPSLKNKQKRAARVHQLFITREPRFHVAGDFRARCRCVVFALLSLKGETSSERTELLSYLKKTNEGITYLGVQLFR